MATTRKYLAILMACIIWPPSFADDISFRQVTVSHGLSQTSAFAVQQDIAGFIWIGTQDGLNRYDGYEFKRYIDRNDDLKSIASGYINDIAIQSESSILLASVEGISDFNPITETSVNYNISDGLPSNTVNELEIVDGRIWAGTSHGLAIQDGRRFKTVQLLKQPNEINVITLADSPAGLWVGTERNGIFRLDPQSTQIVEHLTADSGIHDNSITALMVHEGDLWVGTPKGLSIISDSSAKKNLLKSFQNSIGQQQITTLFVDSQKNIWVGTKQGLWIYNKEKRTHHLARNPADLSSLSDNHITSIFEDREGLIWIGTWANGVNIFDPHIVRLRDYSRYPGIEPLTKKAIQTFYQDSKNNLWVGTRRDGVFILNVQTHQLDSITFAPSVMPLQVDTIYVENDQRVWIGTSKGLFVTDSHSRVAKKILLDKRLDNTWVRTMSADHQGRLWLGTESYGAFILDLSTLSVEHIFASNESPMKLSHNKIWDIFHDDNGLHWIATWNGLDIIDLDKRKLYTYRRQEGVSLSLSSNQLNVIFKHPSSGDYWIGTKGGGIVRAKLNRISDHGPALSFQSFTPQEGFAGESVGQILMGPEEELWVSTNRSLVKITFPDTENQTQKNSSINFRTFSAGAGALKTGYLIGSALKTNEGYLMFGGFDGISSLNPTKITEDQRTPQAMPVNLYINNQRQQLNRQDTQSPLRKRVNYENELVLAPEQSIFSFDFSALQYANPLEVAFKYRLKGFSNDWLLTDGKRRVAAFTKPPPGKYIFELSAASSDGIWQEKPYTLSVIVQPPWWKTRFAYTVYIVLLLATAYFLYRYYKNLLLLYAFKEAALTDSLTGLNNRRFFESSIQADISQALRYQSKGITDSDLIFYIVDIDFFKRINDVHGHDAGDTILVELSAIMKSVFRASDYLIRWGGEEFVVVSRFSNAKQASDVAERLRHSVENHSFNLDTGQQVQLTVSIGFSKFPFDDTHPKTMSWRDVLEFADTALYFVKHNGRNGWTGVFAGDKFDKSKLITMNDASIEEKVKQGQIKLTRSISVSNNNSTKN